MYVSCIYLAVNKNFVSLCCHFIVILFYVNGVSNTTAGWPIWPENSCCFCHFRPNVVRLGFEGKHFIVSTTATDVSWMMIRSHTYCTVFNVSAESFISSETEKLGGWNYPEEVATTMVATLLQASLLPPHGLFLHIHQVAAMYNPSNTWFPGTHKWHLDLFGHFAYLTYEPHTHPPRYLTTSVPIACM